MADKTLIAWTDRTFNAAWGCVKVSPGCKNCYADTLSRRYGHDVWGPGKARRVFGDKHWAEPLRWNAEAAASGARLRVFCGSMFDWAEDHPTITALVPRVFDLIRRTPWLDWQLLTKRPENIAARLPADWGAGYPNVWLGTSIENADYLGRADILRRLSATVRFASLEPLLGPLPDLDLTGIDWAIVGGESGPGYRPMQHEWARQIQRRCAAAGTAFFFKQSAAPLTERGIELDGRIQRDYPRRRIVLPVLSPSFFR